MEACSLLTAHRPIGPQAQLTVHSRFTAMTLVTLTLILARLATAGSGGQHTAATNLHA